MRKCSRRLEPRARSQVQTAYPGADGKLYVAISTGIATIDRSTEPHASAATRHSRHRRLRRALLAQGRLGWNSERDNPGRVIRIALGDQGTRISGITVLQSHHHPEFAEPTTGAIAADALFVIANSYVGHFQPEWEHQRSGATKPTAIVAVPLKP